MTFKPGRPKGARNRLDSHCYEVALAHVKHRLGDPPPKGIRTYEPMGGARLHLERGPGGVRPRPTLNCSRIFSRVALSNRVRFSSFCEAHRPGNVTAMPNRAARELDAGDREAVEYWGDDQSLGLFPDKSAAQSPRSSRRAEQHDDDTEKNAPSQGSGQI